MLKLEQPKQRRGTSRTPAWRCAMRRACACATRTRLASITQTTFYRPNICYSLCSQTIRVCCRRQNKPWQHPRNTGGWSCVQWSWRVSRAAVFEKLARSHSHRRHYHSRAAAWELFAKLLWTSTAAKVDSPSWLLQQPAAAAGDRRPATPPPRSAARAPAVGFKSYAERVVVGDPFGPFTCIVGPNGCGKSVVVSGHEGHGRPGWAARLRLCLACTRPTHPPTPRRARPSLLRWVATHA